MKPAVLLVVLISCPSGVVESTNVIIGAQEETTDVHKTLARLSEEIDTIKQQLNISSSDESLLGIDNLRNRYDQAAIEYKHMNSVTPAWYFDWKFHAGAGILVCFALFCFVVCSCGECVSDRIGDCLFYDSVVVYAWLVIGVDFLILCAFERSHKNCFAMIFWLVGLSGLFISCCSCLIRLHCDDLEERDDPCERRVRRAVGLHGTTKCITISDSNTVLETVQVKDKYLDVAGTSTVKCLLVFGAQTMFFSYCVLHLYNLNDFGYYHLDDFKHLFFWASSIPAQLLVTKQMGKGWVASNEYARFNHLLLQGGVVQGGVLQGGLVEDLSDDQLQDAEVSVCAIGLRMFMSFLVNHIYYVCLVLALPLMAMQAEDGLDFVKDAFAIGFVTTLDDVEPKDMILRLPPKIKYDSSDEETPTEVSRMLDPAKLTE